MTYHINYSFFLRWEPETFYSVNVPLSKLEGKELDIELVRNVVEEDEDLILDLFGPHMLKIYEEMSTAPHLYPKELQRIDESIRLVSVKKDAELNPVRLESTLRDFVSIHVDYDIHKNFISDENTGEDSYATLTEEFIKIYNKKS